MGFGIFSLGLRVLEKSKVLLLLCQFPPRFGDFGVRVVKGCVKSGFFPSPLCSSLCGHSPRGRAFVVILGSEELQIVFPYGPHELYTRITRPLYYTTCCEGRAVLLSVTLNGFGFGKNEMRVRPSGIGKSSFSLSYAATLLLTPDA